MSSVPIPPVPGDVLFCVGGQHPVLRDPSTLDPLSTLDSIPGSKHEGLLHLASSGRIVVRLPPPSTGLVVLDASDFSVLGQCPGHTHDKVRHMCPVRFGLRARDVTRMSSADAEIDSSPLSSPPSFFATCTNRTVRLWDTTTFTTRARFSPHISLTVSVIADIPWLDSICTAGGGRDTRVRVWNPMRPRRATMKLPTSGRILSMIPHLSRRVLLTGATDSSLRLWDVRSTTATSDATTSGEMIRLRGFSVALHEVASTPYVLVLGSSSRGGRVSVVDLRKLGNGVGGGLVRQLDLDCHGRAGPGYHAQIVAVGGMKFVSAVNNRSLALWGGPECFQAGEEGGEIEVLGAASKEIIRGVAAVVRNSDSGAVVGMSDVDGIGETDEIVQEMAIVEETETTNPQALPEPEVTTQHPAVEVISSIASFLRAAELEDYIALFEEEEAVLSDLPAILEDSEYLSELFPKRLPRRRFQRAVQSLLASSCSARQSGFQPTSPPMLSTPSPFFSSSFGSISTRTPTPTTITTSSASSRFSIRSGLTAFEALAWDSVQVESLLPIASGAFGTIRRGVFEGMDVVVKDIPCRTQKARELAMAEFTHLLKFQHLHVVRVYGHSIREGVLQGLSGGKFDVFRIVMESMEGSLRDLVCHIRPLSGTETEISISDRLDHQRSVSLTLFQKFGLLQQCAEVLSYMHGRKTMHRDVKAANFLVGGILDPWEDAFSPCIKIGSFIRSFLTVTSGDFGLAKLNVTEQAHTGKKGTVFWMSPEVMEGREYSYQADIYSFGCTCYEVLHGCPPWRSKHDSLRHVFNRFNAANHITSGSRPSLDLLREHCEPFATLIEGLWSRPALEEFDSMEKVVRWFEDYEGLMRREFSNLCFHDEIGAEEVFDFDLLSEVI